MYIHILYIRPLCHYSTHLMSSIQELQKDWAEVMFQSCPVCLVTSFGERVPKGKPVLLHHHTKSLQGAVVGVQHQLHQGNYLGGVRQVYVHLSRVSAANNTCHTV